MLLFYIFSCFGHFIDQPIEIVLKGNYYEIHSDKYLYYLLL